MGSALSDPKESDFGEDAVPISRRIGRKHRHAIDDFTPIDLVDGFIIRANEAPVFDLDAGFAGIGIHDGQFCWIKRDIQAHVEEIGDVFDDDVEGRCRVLR